MGQIKSEQRVRPLRSACALLGSHSVRPSVRAGRILCARSLAVFYLVCAQFSHSFRTFRHSFGTVCAKSAHTAHCSTSTCNCPLCEPSSPAHKQQFLFVFVSHFVGFFFEFFPNFLQIRAKSYKFLLQFDSISSKSSQTLAKFYSPSLFATSDLIEGSPSLASSAGDKHGPACGPQAGTPFITFGQL